MKGTDAVLWLVAILTLLTSTICSAFQFEERVDASMGQISTMLADDVLSTETYTAHPNTHLLSINALRYTVMDLMTSIRHTLINKYARPQHAMTTQQAHLIKMFDLRFTDIPLPNVFILPHLEKLEFQLGEMKWHLSTARSHLKPGWLNIRADHSAMLITCARIVKDYVERYNSIRLLGEAPPPYSLVN